MYCLSPFCCVCLNDGVKLHDINQLDTDGLPLINKIIFVSFGHEAIDFKVVRYICLECTTILQSAYTFKRSCLVNHELLRIYSSQLKYFTGKPSEYQDLVVSLERLPEKNEDEQVPEIAEDKQNEDNENIVTEIRIVPVNIISPNKKKINDVKIKCNMCDAGFNRYALLQMHYNTKHKSLFKVLKKKLSSKKSTLSYTCNICSNKLASIFSLTRHLQLHGLKKIACKFCDVHFENNESYKTHLTTIHANRSTLRCDMCDLTLESDFHFRRHMFLKHTPRKCKHCNEIFFSNSELWTHNADNHRVHKCNVCEKAFTLLKNLRTHMKIHENPVSNLFEDETSELITVYPVIEMPVVKQPETKIDKIDKIEHIPHQTVLLNSRLRKKCTNCLSVFGSGISLKKHKCFKLNKNMLQCDKCFIIYSKKSSFINHVKNCTLQSNLTENIANTPELQESEQTEIETDTTSLLEAVTPDENVVKKENDLEIKEEILDDFICNAQTKEKESFEIGEVYSMSEFPETDNQDVSSPVIDAPPVTAAAIKANDNSDNVDINVKQPKKTFPKIKLIEKNTPKRAPEGYAELLNALRLRCKDISVLVDESTDATNKKNVDEEIAPNKEINTNKENDTSEEIDTSEENVTSEEPAANKSNPTSAISSSSDIKIDKFQRFNLRRKIDIVETTETIFTNTEFSDSNDSTARSGDNQDIVDPLFGFDEAAKSNCTSRSASVSRDSFSDFNPPAENIETVKVQTKTVGTKKDSISKRRKSIWNEHELNENLDEIINVENVGTVESSIIGTESSNIRPEPSIVGTEPSIVGAKPSIVGTETSIVGTETSIVGPETSFVGTETSVIGAKSSIVQEESSMVRTESSNINVESSNIGEESSDIETVESSNTIIEAKKRVITNRRRNISSEDTSNENSNESLFHKTVKTDITKGSGRKRRKSIWLDDMIELNDSFNFDDLIPQNKESTNTGPTITENTETVNKETFKRSVKRRRKSIWMEDTSNENSRESFIEKSDNTETTEIIQSPIPVNEQTTKKSVKKRRKSVWMEVTSNENSSESFIEKTDNTDEIRPTITENTETVAPLIPVNKETTKKSVKIRRQSVWMEDTSNENSRESFVEKPDNTEQKGSQTTENTETIVSLKPVNKETKKLVKIRRQSVWMESTSNENSNDSLIEKAVNTEKVGPAKSKKRRKSTHTSNENSNDSFIDKLDNLEQTEPKKTSTKGRRKSIWMELNEELSDKNIVETNASATAISVESSRKSADLVKKPLETNKKDVVKMRRKSVYIEGIPNDVDYLSTDNENETGSDLRCHIDKTNNEYSTKTDIKNKVNPENTKLEPIILKTRRSIKQSTKSRRKVIQVYDGKTETQENETKSSDVNKNVDDAKKLTVNCISSSKSPDFLTSSACSSVQTFKLRSLHRKSICEGEQGPKLLDDPNIENKLVPENDTNYITVRKVSDINNDISGQQK